MAIGAVFDALQGGVHGRQLLGFVVVQGEFEFALGGGLCGGVFVLAKVVGRGFDPTNRAAAQRGQLGQKRGALLQQFRLKCGGVQWSHGVGRACAGLGGGNFIIGKPLCVVFDLGQSVYAWQPVGEWPLKDNHAMLTLQALRQARTLAQLVLVWLVLAVGVAVAAPLVQPQSSTLVCTASGAVKLLAGGEEGGVAPAHHTLDCVLCLALSAPPPAPVLGVAAVHALRHTPEGQPAAHPAWRTASPLPARGPPAAV